MARPRAGGGNQADPITVDVDAISKAVQSALQNAGGLAGAGGDLQNDAKTLEAVTKAVQATISGVTGMVTISRASGSCRDGFGPDL